MKLPRISSAAVHNQFVHLAILCLLFAPFSRSHYFQPHCPTSFAFVSSLSSLSPKSNLLGAETSEALSSIAVSPSSSPPSSSSVSKQQQRQSISSPLQKYVSATRARVDATPVTAPPRHGGLPHSMTPSQAVFNLSHLRRGDEREDLRERKNEGRMIKERRRLYDHFARWGFAVVRLDDEGDILRMNHLWKYVVTFFERTSHQDGCVENIPKLSCVPGSRSPLIKTGYVGYPERGMEFLETRLRLESVPHSPLHEKEKTDPVDLFLPKGIAAILGDNGDNILRRAVEAQKMLVSIGREVVLEVMMHALHDIFGKTTDLLDVEAAAKKIVKDFVDDGQMLATTVEDAENDGEEAVCMSPHRLCRYSFVPKNQNQSDSDSDTARESFGAHTDTSFLTLVPASKVAGLEIWCENNAGDGGDKGMWIKPEALAKENYCQNFNGNNDPSWHDRYLVVMAGEITELLTLGQVPSAVHRVLTVRGAKSRYSAPMLMRSRVGAKMDLHKYYGFCTSSGVGLTIETSGQQEKGKNDENIYYKYLKSIDGIEMEELHMILQ